MAPLTLQIAAVVALAALLYVVLFVGRRGRNLPPGRDQTLSAKNDRALISGKALQHYLSLAICTNSQPKSSFSSMLINTLNP